MTIESGLLLLLIGAAVAPFIALGLRVGRRTQFAFVVGVVGLWGLGPLIFGTAAITSHEEFEPERPPENRPIVDRSRGYTGASACKSCHPAEHHSWHHSWHRTMTQVASPNTVLGDRQSMHWMGKSWALNERDGQLFADSEIPPAVRSPSANPSARIERPVVLTTGSHHMQVCWFSLFDDNRSLAMLPFAWVKEAQRWIPRDAVFLTPPGREMTSEVGRWRSECIACHATAGRAGLKHEPIRDPDGGYTVRFSETDPRVMDFGISCEACHGPGEEHIKKHQSPLGRYASHMQDGMDTSIVKPSRLSHEKSSQVCGQCHSISVTTSFAGDVAWSMYGHDYRPGDDLNRSERRRILRCGLKDQPQGWEESFWADGQVRVSGREYNGLIESPCFQRGEMSCLSCHDMHSDATSSDDLKTWANDQLGHGMHSNTACLQCHENFANEKTLVEHTHHSANSSGSQCYNCHMSYTTYGLLKALRSHTIEVPSVQTSLDVGRPNACNQCHLDQTLAWTAKNMNAWYDQPEPDLSADEKNIAASILWALKGDAGQRALMGWSFGWKDAQQASKTDWMPPILNELLNDKYHAIRYIAARSMRTIPGYEIPDYDFLAGPANWTAATQEIFSRWLDESPAERDAQTLKALLQTSRGLNRGEVNRLLSEQDQRPVNLGE